MEVCWQMKQMIPLWTQVLNYMVVLHWNVPRLPHLRTQDWDWQSICDLVAEQNLGVVKMDKID